MNNQENASLVLRTADLTPNSTNSIGSCDLGVSNMTWFNINLRTLLGNMYDKYDRFSLVPMNFQSANPVGNMGATADDRNVTLNISGLPFTNNVYNAGSKTNISSAVFNIARFSPTTYASSTFGSSVLTFTKNQELVNLNIFYQRINKNANGTFDVVQGTSAFPDSIFTFNIMGIDKHDRVADLNSSRIF